MSWIASLFSRRLSKIQPVSAKRRRAARFHRPVIDRLEDRLTPSGGVPELLKDLAPGTKDALALDASIVSVGSSVFYAADDGVNGRELWKSDGTTAGTALVKDINPGNSPSYPHDLTNVNGTLYFVTNLSFPAPELWKSDGTEAGTVLVKRGNPLTGELPSYLTNVNGTLFFTARTTANGRELWKSDGTEAGTILVKDINPGSDSSSPGSLTNVNGTLFFTVQAPLSGLELWKSDGTEAGTVLLKNVGPGPSVPSPDNLTNVNGTLFFTDRDSVYGQELWKSDGTPAGTVLVKDIVTGSIGSYPGPLTNVNGTLFFSASDGVTGKELWKSDGTAAGTVLVKDINGGSGGSNSQYLTNVNGTLFFRANNTAAGYELWKSDGTEFGTVLVKDINPKSNSSNPRFLTNVNGLLFFSASDGANGYELWKSDGTAASTVIVKDINPGAAGTPFSLGSLTNLNGTLFFRASEVATGYELWKSNGTTTGTVLVKDINPRANSSYPYPLTNVNGTLFFTATDNVNGPELWKSDGTAASTVLVKDIYPGAAGSAPGNLTNVNGTLFFRAFDEATGHELWKSDGTATGTVLVKDVIPGFGGSFPLFLANVNGTLFFLADDGARGHELWKSDGTDAGTVLVKDINPGSGGSFPVPLTNVNGTLYFKANDGVNGSELWKSDGTADGTILVKDINPGNASSYLSSLTNLNGTLYFRALTAANGYELWKSDGTANGTILVKDIAPGSNSSEPLDLTAVNGTLFFRASDGVVGSELWRSDGTTAGTVLVKDIKPGSGFSSPFFLTNVNGTLYFSAGDDASGYELWKSDGTAAGTVLVKDINTSGGSFPYNLTNVNGTVYFMAFEPNTGAELWQSDGTAAGTQLVLDIAPGAAGSDARLLTNIDGKLFFSANDGVRGHEPWVLLPGAGPTARAGGPYFIDSGQNLSLNGGASTAASGTSIVSYAWDIDNNGQFNDASGASPTILSTTLVNLGVNGAGQHTIGLKVVDSNGLSSTAQSTFTIRSSTTTTISAPTAAKFGDLVTITVTVTAASGSGPTGTVQIFDGATAIGYLTLPAGSTSVTFSTSNLSIGTHSLRASYQSNNGYLDSGSDPFTITIDPAAAKALRFSVQPSNVAPNAAITPAITVQLLNENGNIVTADNSTAITIALGSNPGAATLSGTSTRTAVNGAATFNGLSLDKRGVGYTFTATASGFTATTSASFNVSSQRVSVWDGGGDNDRWSTPANWFGDLAVQPDDGLVFPTSTFRTLSTNDFPAGTVFDSITIEGNGYDIAGNGIVLTAGLLSTATATNVFRLGVGLNRDQTITIVNTDAVLRMTGPLTGSAGLVKSGAGVLVLEAANTYTGATTVSAGTLRLGIGEAASPGSASWTLDVNPVNRALLDLNNQSATLRTLNGGGQVQLGPSGGTLTIGVSASGASSNYAGAIVGDGSVRKLGSGRLTLAGANTFNKTLLIAEGDVRLDPGGSLNDNLVVDVATTSTFELSGGVVETIQSLSGAGKAQLTGTSTLVLSVPTGTSGTFDGQVQGTGNLRKTGAGTFTLTKDGGFSGIVDVAGGTLVAGSGRALGANNAALPAKVIVRTGNTLVLDFTTGQALDYSLSLEGGTLLNRNGDNSWTGPIAFTAGTLRIDGASLSLTGNLTGAGGFTKTGARDLVLQPAGSAYAGETIIDQGKLVVGVANALGTAAAGTRVRQSAFLEFRGAAAIQYNEQEKLTLEKCTVIVNQAGDNSFAGDLELLGNSTIEVQAGRLTLSGAISAGAFTLVVKGAGVAELEGTITGTGRIEVRGAKTILRGVSDVTFTGVTRIFNGSTLFVNGRLGGEVQIEDGAILGGKDGVVGKIVVEARGVLSPGESPGTLTAANGITFLANGTTQFELIRPTGDFDPYLPPELLTQDRVIVKDGTLDLSQGPQLNLVVPQKINLQRDLSIVLFDNKNPVVGRFRDLDEGAVVNLGNFSTLYRITYRGGADGNDIVLIRGIPTVTTLATSTTTVAPGQALQATATVQAGVPGAPKSPSGKTILLDGGTGRGDAAVSGGQAGFNFSPGALGPGLHEFRAAYQGDDDFQPSTSAGVVSVTVEAPPASNFGSFSLAANSFLVSEKDGGLTLIVSRTGGADGAVTVDYAVTTAASLPLRLQAALDRDIQGTLSGRLSFAAGETSKTLTIAIVNDNLVEDDESFIISLGNATGGATLGSPAGATVTLRDDDLPSVPNETPPAARLELAGSGFGKSTEHYQNFVAKAYQRFLGRAADAAGFEYWVGLMKLYEDSKHAQGLRQEQIEAGFIASPEYEGRYGGTAGEAWIRGIYKDLLGRAADEGGVAFWLAQRAAGVTADNVALGFTSSDERLKNRVMETYRTLLEREADQAGLAYWVAIFKAGGTTEDINSGFVGSQEYYKKPNRGNNNPAQWTRSAYLDILFRPAATSEIDYWLRFLKG